MEATHERLRDNKLRYLNSIGCLVSNNLLKSHYSIKYASVASREQMKLPSRFHNQRCPKCLILYEENPPIVTIGAEPNLSAFARKVSKKQNTAFQGKYHKRLQRKNCNYLITQCDFCKNKNEKLLKKNKKLNEEPVKTLRKIKKKRDKFSGLNAAVVLAATDQKNNPSIKNITNTLTITQKLDKKQEKLLKIKKNQQRNKLTEALKTSTKKPRLNDFLNAMLNSL